MSKSALDENQLRNLPIEQNGQTRIDFQKFFR